MKRWTEVENMQTKQILQESYGLMDFLIEQQTINAAYYL